MGERSGRKEAMSSSSCNLKSFMIIIQKMQIIFIEGSKEWGWGGGWGWNKGAKRVNGSD